ncbi:hypothetical protein CR513_00074, partial [Mucuna pruriens]
MGENRYLQHMQKNLWQEYESILSPKELYYFQKSRCEWIQFGDHITRFYHTSTIVQKKRNKVEALLDQRVRWFLIRWFLKIWLKIIFKVSTLLGNLTKDSLSLRKMHLKRLRNHSLIIKFDQQSLIWALLRPSSQMDCTQFSSKKISPWIQEINRILLVLIPKCDAPTSLHQFHPFSLCIVKMFMPMLVGPNQCSYVPGRHVIDNVEIFHSMSKKKGKSDFMAIKVDLEKEFLLMEYLLVNFHLLEELDKRLAHLIKRKVVCNNYKSIKLCRTKPSISHLFFGDDLLLFGEANIA